MNKQSATIAKLLDTGATLLSANPWIDNPVFESQLLLAHCLKQTRSHLFAWPENTVDAQHLTAFESLINARLNGQPIAYITGTKEFWSLPITVTADTLIPRPETERLVEIALEVLPRTNSIEILELATGSGALAIALAQEFIHATLIASDVSRAALNVAKANVQNLAPGRIRCIQSDWYEQIPQKTFDLIVANPPYVADDDEHLNQGDVRFEPELALRAGPEGLDAIDRIISGAAAYLKPDGFLLLEHGYDQQNNIIQSLHAHGFNQVKGYNDFNQLPRAVVATDLTRKQ